MHRDSLLYSTVTLYISVPRDSKAPRGLFVLLLVGSIFTAISNSPGLLSRQLQSRYTFRAGRNLPDKEFRYHRTLIVRAAVHRGFICSLIPNLAIWGSATYLTFRHWAGLSPYTSAFAFAQTCVFVKQSLCILLLYPGYYTGKGILHSLRLVNLPSSLREVLPSVLVYSTSSPVSVCGTDYLCSRCDAFLGN